MQTVAQNTIFAVVTVTTYPTISTSVALAMNLCGGQFILRLTGSSACRAGDRQTAGLKFTPHRRGVAGGWLRPWLHPDKLTEAPMQNWLKICSHLITSIHCTLLFYFNPMPKLLTTFWEGFELFIWQRFSGPCSSTELEALPPTPASPPLVVSIGVSRLP